MKRLTRRKKWIVGVVAPLVVVGAAWAAWTVLLSHPQAKGKLATLSVTAATPSAAPGNLCLPNSTCDGNIRVNNGSGTALVLTGLSAGGGTPTATTDSGSCIGSDISSTVSIPAKSGLSIPVPAGASDVTIPGLFQVGNVGTQCQGVTFTLTYGSGFDVTVSTP